MNPHTQATSTNVSPPEPLADNIKEHWALKPEIAFLNHGSFGARPRSVMEAQIQKVREFEADPVQILDRDGPQLLAHIKQSVGDFLRINPADFGLVSNATEAFNAVMRSIQWSPHDEVVMTNHGYPGINNTVNHLAKFHGFKVREVNISVPITNSDEVRSALSSALSDHTRLVVIDHITSPTALIFPVVDIVEDCKQRGVDVLIDSAHGPGMFDVSPAELGAAYYVGNLHKWVCAPTGSALLWVHPDKQEGIHPLTISNFYGEGFPEEFRWQGTRGIESWLCIPDAIEFGNQWGWDRIRRHNHDLAVWVQQLLCQRWNADSLSPLDGSLLGSMVSIPLPQQAKSFSESEIFQVRLYDEFRIEVPIFPWQDHWLIRPCCQIYNQPEEYERLANAVEQLLA